jgi:hypothetical protein
MASQVLQVIAHAHDYEDVAMMCSLVAVVADC